MEKKYRIVNDKTTIERTIVLEKLSKEEAGILRHCYEKCQEKALKIIKKINIPEEEKLDSYFANVNYEDELELIIHSREKWRIEEEEKIKKLLNDKGYKISDYCLDLTEDNWIKIDGEFSFSKENLLNIEKIIEAKDFEVGFDDWMGQSFIFYKL